MLSPGRTAAADPARPVLFMSKVYRVAAFAKRAGVTVKTLHHYDRLGLLKPTRTASGYRAYTDADLQRLEEIAALKVIGVPLKEIAQLLQGAARPLGEILEAQRRGLHARRRVIDRAIGAIEAAQHARASAAVSDADVLRTLIEVIEMQSNEDVLKVFFDDEAWVRWHAAHPQWPGPEWHALLRDVEAALERDPAGPEGQALVQRWNALVESDIGTDGQVRRAFTKAWRDWTMKPETRPPLLAAYDTDRILRFIVNATGAMVEERARAAGHPPQRVSASRLQLFNEAKALLGTPPDGPAGRDLGRRLRSLMREELGDDEQLIDDVRRAWRRRKSWPEAMQRWVASAYDADVETFTAVTDFMDAAFATAR